jgi:diacylglycerol O-acyltransferase / wax synthase
MEQLSGLDAAFLALETGRSAGHVGGLCIVERSVPPDVLDLARLTDLVAERLSLVPVLRRKLLEVPLGLDQPYWVDDRDFDLEYHVREVSLPRPGTEAQLTEQLCRLHSRPLDRRRPLWEMYLVSGLEGDRTALYTKIHHAAIDGVSGAELMTILLDLSPEGREVPPADDFEPQGPPSPPELAVRTAARLARRPMEAVRLAGRLMRTVPVLAPAVAPLVGGLLGLDRGDGAVIASPVGLAPPTPFNKPITPHRRLALRTVDLDAVKRVKNAFGVSVNDVVMAMAAGALRRWLLDHDALPDLPLVAMIPVSVRDESAHSPLGNRVSAMLAHLPTNLADPAERLQIAHEATTVAKAQHGAIPDGLVDGVTEFAVPALTARVARVVWATGIMHRLPPFNLVVSNVPGPDVPVYVAGARVLALYPMSVVLDGQGLNITVAGYHGRLHVGLLSCRELVPDLERLGDYLVEELDELEGTAGQPA